MCRGCQEQSNVVSWRCSGLFKWRLFVLHLVLLLAVGWCRLRAEHVAANNQ